MDIVIEIENLKRRVGDLEGAVNVLTRQLGKVHPDLVSLTETTLKRFDNVENLINRAVTRLDSVNSQVWSLRDDFPHVITAAIKAARED